MTETPFPMNAWYPAAWDYELKRELTARTICGRDIVMYRRGGGGVVALEDACWHRLLPLSLGHLKGDEVVCGYHGLVFNAAGRCTHMPAQETINPSACVRAYPVAEKYRLVWVWMGDPALADPEEVPDFHWNSDPPWVGDGGTFYSLQCDWRLVVDNLMDLTHETFVHAGSIGDDAITRNPFEVTHAGRRVTMSRWMEGIDPPPFWARLLGRPGPVDRWQIIRFDAPCVVAGDVGVALAGTGARQGDRAQGVNGFFLAAIAPETETSCHYFWNFVRNFRTEDQGLTRSLNLAHVNQGRGVYDQDHEVLEAQQRAINRNPRQPFYNLNIDAGALWARRAIDRMVAAERSGGGSPTGAAPPGLAAE
jgi:phenylpropionate dioxygenase-like ring-hydroxylating dioxygenase large terminal subunit